ncbi:hypothetical protein OF897_00005 [Chryseobacterium formosus]|uniref:Uncharacterized protein n=1 Tax=Chryseobacterium formosus TaxID=1537363 RepID=A0ABT3XJG4_9FLAO|nr:hypothetical protein [Chryseobacterium formosus]MCX8522303.1 hypothetical protein [Chryseobacterium formosus]
MKQFEANKTQYINQPLSKLLQDIIKLQPQSLYTQIRGCNYDSQLYFTDVNKKFGSRFKINIVWKSSPFYESERINNLNELSNFKELEYVYKKYIIKNIEFNYNADFYISHNAAKAIKDDDPYIHLNTYLEKYKKDHLINRPFFDFICWAKPIQIKRLRNIFSKPKAAALQTEFIVVNPYYKNKKAKIIVDWDSPIPLNQIQEYKNKNGNRFSSNERNLFVDIIVKDIRIYRR